jgi:hypothetical protein
MPVHMAGVSFVRDCAAAGNVGIQFTFHVDLYIARAGDTHVASVYFQIGGIYFARAADFSFDFFGRAAGFKFSRARNLHLHFVKRIVLHLFFPIR